MLARIGSYLIPRVPRLRNSKKRHPDVANPAGNFPGKIRGFPCLAKLISVFIRDNGRPDPQRRSLSFVPASEGSISDISPPCIINYNLGIGLSISEPNPPESNRRVRAKECKHDSLPVVISRTF